MDEKIISSVLVKNQNGQEVSIPANLCLSVKPSLLERIFVRSEKVIFAGSKETKQLALATEMYYEKILKLQKGRKYKVIKFKYSSLN